MMPFDEISDLEIATALWRVGEIRTDQLPRIACDLLSTGLDNNELRMLAGLTAINIERAPELFEKIIDDTGYSVMPVVQATRIFLQFVAKKIVSGEIEPYQGARLIFAVVVRAGVGDFHDADPFIYAADEYEERPEDRKFFEAKIIAEAKQWLHNREKE